MRNEYADVLELGKVYFSGEALTQVKSLPIVSSDPNEVDFDTVDIYMPDWAQDCFDKGVVEVYRHCIVGSYASWEYVDWHRFSWELVTGYRERVFERENNPTHSYKTNVLTDSHTQRAIVNRVFLFYRKWVSNNLNLDELEVFSPKPKGKVLLTHDVDYVRKTLPLIIKNSIFCFYGLALAIIKFDNRAFFSKWNQLIKCFSINSDYWQFEVIQELEARYNAKSYWNFYSHYTDKGFSFKKWLFDPSYDVNDTKIKNKIKELIEEGHVVGLHQSFDSWKCFESMNQEKLKLESITGQRLTTCRQHWLRFSFKETWAIQERCGIQLDTTLGFNNQVGFRNSCALIVPAYIDERQSFSKTLSCLPMVLMDSHLHDYEQSSLNSRRKTIDYILDEIELVGGIATIIWHQRVFHSDYGWGDDYEYLLQALNERGML